MSNLDRYKKDLKSHVATGEQLLNAINAEFFPDQFEAETKKKIGAKKAKEFIAALPSFALTYQSWYSEARVLIRQLLPDRLEDFVRHYEKPKARKNVTFESYRIEDYLQGLSVNRIFGSEKEKIVGPEAAIPHFLQQLAILRAVIARFESSLFDIRQLVMADIFDSELDAAWLNWRRRSSSAELARRLELCWKSTYARCVVIIESTVAAAANNAPEITTTSPLQVTDANEQPAQPASPTVSVTSDGFDTITLSTARTCTENEIQLEGGTSAAEGNVVICHESKFRPVCDDFWSDEDAGVVCRQLGYATGSYTQESFFGDSEQLGVRTERGELRGEGPGPRDGLHHPGPRRGRIERERPGGGDGDNYGVHQQPPRSSPRIRRRARWPAAAPRSRRLAIRSRRRTRTTTI